MRWNFTVLHMFGSSNSTSIMNETLFRAKEPATLGPPSSEDKDGAAAKAVFIGERHARAFFRPVLAYLRKPTTYPSTQSITKLCSAARSLTIPLVAKGGDVVLVRNSQRQVTLQKATRQERMLSTAMTFEFQSCLGIPVGHQACLGFQSTNADMIGFASQPATLCTIQRQVLLLVECKLQLKYSTHYQVANEWVRTVNIYNTGPAIVVFETDKSQLVVRMIVATDSETTQIYQSIASHKAVSNFADLQAPAESATSGLPTGINLFLGQALWSKEKDVQDVIGRAKCLLRHLEEVYTPQVGLVSIQLPSEVLLALQGAVADDGQEVLSAQIVAGYGPCLTKWTCNGKQWAVKVFDNSASRKPPSVALLHDLKAYSSAYASWAVVDIADQVSFLVYEWIDESAGTTPKTMADIFQMYCDVFLTKDRVHGDLLLRNTIDSCIIDFDMVGELNDDHLPCYPPGYNFEDTDLHRHPALAELASLRRGISNVEMHMSHDVHSLGSMIQLLCGPNGSWDHLDQRSLDELLAAGETLIQLSKQAQLTVGDAERELQQVAGILQACDDSGSPRQCETHQPTCSPDQARLPSGRSKGAVNSCCSRRAPSPLCESSAASSISIVEDSILPDAI
eukprot:TRINITY_DN5162_c0_g1_i1.p2 TRINITY_DN5162_c0_g1~~TRINITY_DN5162_c0_g1_i1.p2  ORF type:complete len:622 (+),score=59.29 TRINITY_DN5162_c0_g1_i1:2249-4114(+)